jgi:hypothetical protein
MASQELVEQLSEGIERLAQGQSVAQISTDAGDNAAQLRVLLESGLLTRRARYSPSEIGDALARIDQIVLPALSNANGGAWTRPSLFLFGIISLIGLSVSGVLVLWSFSTTPAPAATATTTPAPSATTTPAPSATTSNTLPPAATVTTPATTAISQGDDARIVIEGPIEAITGNTITVLGQTLTVDPTDPRISAIQIGDVVRVEGEQQESTVQVVVLVFISVDVAVSVDGSLWRDSGDCANPPPDWAPANGWRRRCAGGAPNIGNADGSNGGGDDNDDD